MLLIAHVAVNVDTDVEFMFLLNLILMLFSPSRTSITYSSDFYVYVDIDVDIIVSFSVSRFWCWQHCSFSAAPHLIFMFMFILMLTSLFFLSCTSINSAFEELRRHVPTFPYEKRLSKVYYRLDIAYSIWARPCVSLQIHAFELSSIQLSSSIIKHTNDFFSIKHDHVFNFGPKFQILSISEPILRAKIENMISPDYVLCYILRANGNFGKILQNVGL